MIRDPQKNAARHQNLTISSLDHALPFHKISALAASLTKMMHVYS